MLSKLSKITIVDNSGAILGKCIHIYTGSTKKGAREGQLVLLSLLKTVQGSNLRKGELYKAVIVRTRANKYSQNGAVLVNTTKSEYTPIGTRIRGPISEKIKFKKGCNKLYSLAKFSI